MPDWVSTRAYHRGPGSFIRADCRPTMSAEVPRADGVDDQAAVDRPDRPRIGQGQRRSCQTSADGSVSDATWSMTTRRRPASAVAASYAGANAGANVPGAPAATAATSS